jgi:integrase
VEFLLKPFGRVTTNDLQTYADAREKQIDPLTKKLVAKPATVDRELDLLSQVIMWAINTKDYHVIKNPMKGLERPRYNNERIARLKGDEEERLLAAAREEDKEQARQRKIERLLQPARAFAAQMPQSLSSRKRYIARARKEIEQSLKNDFAVEPVYETFIEFLLRTAARRGEGLGLIWEHTDLAGKTAFFPETKNGRSRTVPLWARLVQLLERLKKFRLCEKRVFPFTGDAWDGAWERICARAGLAGLHPHTLRHERISQIPKRDTAADAPSTS